MVTEIANDDLQYATSLRGRKRLQKSYKEEDDSDPTFEMDPDAHDQSHARTDNDDKGQDGDNNNNNNDEDEDGIRSFPRRNTRARSNKLNGFIVSDDSAGGGDEDDSHFNDKRRTRSRSAPVTNNKNGEHIHHHPNTRSREKLATTNNPTATNVSLKSRSANRRATRQSARVRHEEAGYEDDEAGGDDADADGSSYDEDASQTSPSPEPEPDPEPEPGQDQDDEDDDEEQQHSGGTADRKYKLRKRAPVNYAIPPPLEEVAAAAATAAAANGKRKNDRGPKSILGRAKPFKWGATGAELSRMMGLPDSDTDSDGPAKTPRKTFGATSANNAATGGLGGGMMANGSATGAIPEFGVGTPSNLGRLGENSLADADPLGINPNITFDSVGGLDDHITALKEMTLLPLLYPELFQRFNLTPPRGVLFHGPPGTGKTLLARALASSCRSGGRSISFFMRKGADVLSKWVGEAERQLRILFEEAKASQPSIIFFDEIDGLAPVRSSRQDQIHASIVATLLALMDGMDNRGQVVVIGATNRPDAVDSALRRPGRFDREFYFPLPNVTARTKIFDILTKDWEGWEGETGDQMRLGLAKLTKGYAGADLRALCTEAALNAVQRRYPQIYQSEQRLLVKPESVKVQLRDFMISVKKLVPSASRSSSSVAIPLPTQLVPLLSHSLEKVQSMLSKTMPVPKKRTALEEAQWEDDEDDTRALEREELAQAIDTLRVYRPRVILHGSQGMGQAYVGAAALHYLEGFHIQSLDLGSLLGDSSRTVEAAIVQLFIEAKRNQPSVIYIPSLTGWCAAVSETARATMQTMLNSLAPTDPVLLLAVSDVPFSSLPRDIRLWFGLISENRLCFASPSREQRSTFYAELINSVQKPPNEFPDAVKRRKRILEKLPVAPPLAPKPPTAAELAAQEQKDEQIIATLKYRLGPILMELKRRFKLFSKPIIDPLHFLGLPPSVERPKIHNIDLERIQLHLYRGKYLTAQDFLDDLQKIVHNARAWGGGERDNERFAKAQMMYTTAQVHTNELDAFFRAECERMAVRERKRREEWAAANPKPDKNASIAAEAEAEAPAPDLSNVNGDTNGPNSLANGQGIRRSARHNGEQADIIVTDISKLERRLKRQRSSEASESQDEKPKSTGWDVMDVDTDDRAAKKPRIESASEHRVDGITTGPVIAADEPNNGDDDETDPLDLVGPTSSQQGSGGRSTVVRFSEENMETYVSSRDTQIHAYSRMSEVTMSAAADVSMASSTSREGTPIIRHTQAIVNGEPSVDVPQSSHHSRLDPSTLVAEHTPALSVPDGPPDSLREEGQAPEPSQASPQEPSISTMEGVVEAQQTQPQHLQLQQPDPPEEEIVSRTRSPSPEPPPPFRISEEYLEQLSDTLTSSTEGLTIEQLEQLRATCLNCVFKRRSDWDRDDMVKELLEITRTFVNEAKEDLLDDD